MATQILSVNELLEIYIGEVEANSDLTDFNEGSINDIEGGAASTAVHEAMTLIVDQFRKTFFDSADGPEVTGGPDDLQTLAVDHFGDTFARPLAQEAIGVVTFSRPNIAAGDVSIIAGTIVKTPTDASGNSQRYKTISSVLMTGTTINASVEALVAGTSGNVASNTITQIESALTDTSVTVNNAQALSGGAPVMNDADYRQYIKNKIEAIKGATVAAIQAAAKTVSGVVIATVVEIEKVVIEWDIGSSSPIGDYFRIPYVTLYIADANGGANNALIEAVRQAVDPVRAAGVRVTILGTTPFVLSWTGAITLNPSGPNFAQLSTDPDPILQTMEDYIAGLQIGTGFDVSDANAAMLAIWGPSGTNDLVSNGFTTVSPSGDVAGSAGVKIIPGTMAIGTC
jgi:hypothetical protein